MPATRGNNSFSDLAFQLFRYASEQLAQNNLDNVLALGFTLEEASKISELTLSEVRKLSQQSSNFVKSLCVDHDCFARLLDRMKQEKDEEVIQDELIKLGAPYAMMSELFGMNGHEYAQRRKLLSLTRVGRPPVPSDEDQERIYEIWLSHKDESPIEMWLHIGQETGLSLTTVWPLVNSWDTLSQSSREDEPARSRSSSEAQRVCA